MCLEELGGSFALSMSIRVYCLGRGGAGRVNVGVPSGTKPGDTERHRK